MNSETSVTINPVTHCPSCGQYYQQGIYHQCPTWGVYQPFPTTTVTEPTFTVKQIQEVERERAILKVQKLFDSYKNSEGSDLISMSKFRRRLEGLMKEIEEG